MKRIFILTRVMIKGISSADISGDSASGKKPLKKIGMTLLLAIVFVYMAGLSVTFVHFTYGILSPLGISNLILELVLSATSFVVFFFGIFYVMSVYYFSKDVDKLLPLPVKPGEIILAKFLSTLFYEYIIVLMFLLPAMIAFGVMSSASFMFYLYALITAVLVPIAPLVLASLIIMLVMRFTPAARNKDRFSLFAGMISLVLALGVNFGMQSLMAKTDTNELAEIISGSAGNISGAVSAIFPGNWFASHALNDPDSLLSLLMVFVFILISAVFTAILYFIGNLLYFKGVIGVSSSSARSRKGKTVTMNELATGGDPFRTYVLKEFRLLLRTPIFFMNNVIVGFLMPAFIALPFIVGGGSSEGGPPSLSGIREMVSGITFQQDKGIAPYIILGFFAFLVFTVGTNGITETAISREGKQAYFMKIIPMSYSRQIVAKITTGVLLSLCSAVFLTVVITALLTPPVWLVLLCVTAIPGAILLPNIFGIIFDLYMPKIKWDNEQKAVKQNLNVLFGMFAAMVMIAVIAVPVIFIDMSFIVSVIYITVLPLLLAAISAYFVNRISSKCMLKLAA